MNLADIHAALSVSPYDWTIEAQRAVIEGLRACLTEGGPVQFTTPCADPVHVVYWREVHRRLVTALVAQVHTSACNWDQHVLTWTFEAFPKPHEPGFVDFVRFKPGAVVLTPPPDQAAPTQAQAQATGERLLEQQ